jgi:hypothetical protein
VVFGQLGLSLAGGGVGRAAEEDGGSVLGSLGRPSARAGIS